MTTDRKWVPGSRTRPPLELRPVKQKNKRKHPEEKSKYLLDWFAMTRMQTFIRLPVICFRTFVSSTLCLSSGSVSNALSQGIWFKRKNILKKENAQTGHVWLKGGVGCDGGWWLWLAGSSGRASLPQRKRLGIIPAGWCCPLRHCVRGSGRQLGGAAVTD